MGWYAKLMIYVLMITITLYAFYFIDFNKFIRVGQKQYAIIIWVLLSLAAGFLIGKLLIELGEIILSI